MTQHASVTYRSLGLRAVDSSTNLTENMLRLLKQLRHTRRNYYLKLINVKCANPLCYMLIFGEPTIGVHETFTV